MELSTHTRRSPLSSTGLVYKVVCVQSMRLHGVEYTYQKEPTQQYRTSVQGGLCTEHEATWS